MKKQLVLVAMMFIVIIACSKQEVITERTCEEVNTYWFNLIQEEAIANGFNPDVPYTINTTEPLEPGYMDPFYDRNYSIYAQVIWK